MRNPCLLLVVILVSPGRATYYEEKNVNDTIGTKKVLSWLLDISAILRCACLCERNSLCEGFLFYTHTGPCYLLHTGAPPIATVADGMRYFKVKEPNCDVILHASSGKELCVRYGASANSYTGATQLCTSMGGNLLEIETQVQFDELLAIIGSGSGDYWVSKVIVHTGYEAWVGSGGKVPNSLWDPNLMAKEDTDCLYLSVSNSYKLSASASCSRTNIRGLCDVTV